MPPTGSGGPIERFLIRSMDLNDQQNTQDNGHTGTPIDDHDGGVELVDGEGDGREGDDDTKRKRHHTSSSSDGETDRFSESLIGNTSIVPLSPPSGPSPQRRPRLLAFDTSGEGSEHENDISLTQEHTPEGNIADETPFNSSSVHSPTNISNQIPTLTPAPTPILTPTPDPTPTTTPTPQTQPIPPSTANLIIEQIRKILEENLTVVETKVDKNTNDIAGVVARVDVIEENLETMKASNTQSINSIDMKVDQFSEDNSQNMERIRTAVNECVRETNRVNQYVEARLNRYDSDMEQLAERNDQAISAISNGTIINQLLQRITNLEDQVSRRNGLSEEEVNEYRKKKTRDNDSYFLRTICIYDFIPVQPTTNPRGDAYRVLRRIGAEDIISAVERVQLFTDSNVLRLTFSSIPELYEAESYIKSTLAQITRNGSRLPFRMARLTPPRFKQRRISLERTALEMKRAGTIKSYSYVIIKDELKLKVIMRNGSKQIIDTPREIQQNDMDQSEQAEVCRICLETLEGSPVLSTTCHHILHERCLKTWMEASGVGCPVCKTLPSGLTTDMVDCSRCKIMIRGHSQEAIFPRLRLTRKCSHLHVDECVTSHLRNIPGFPQTPAVYDQLISSDADTPGCRSCSEAGALMPDRGNVFHTRVQGRAREFMPPPNQTRRNQSRTGRVGNTRDGE